MLTMLFGLLLVVVSAAGFGAALFGRRPIPQTATAGVLVAPGIPLAERGPSSAEAATQVIDAPVEVTRVGGPQGRKGRSTPAGVLPVGRLRRMLQREPTADHEPAVNFTAWTRLRSAATLTVVLLGIGTIIGCLLTIVVVGAVFILT